jgi:hypothetical protein
MSGFFKSLFGRSTESYRIRILSNRFEFEFVRRRDGTVRIYIDSQPCYGRQPSNLQSTHRYYEGGRYYICIQDHLAPRDFAEARTWADYFAVKTAEYLETGHSFS